MMFLLFALISGFLSLLLQPLIIIVSKKYKWFDKPDERKIHTNEISRLGGIGIFAAFFASFTLAFFLISELRLEVISNIPVLVGLGLIFITGLLDDFYNIRARMRFVLQLSVAVALAVFGYKFDAVWLPAAGTIQLGWFAYPLTVLWIVGVINAVNMIDGMDGLCGGISLIALFSFGLILVNRGQIQGSAIAIILSGSIVGYLFYNFPPAKIFMGDSGSNMLGYALAVLPLLEKNSISTGTMLWIAPTILLLPIFDVFAAMWRRLRQGNSIMSPDRWHIHHKLMHLGFSNRAILALIYSVCMSLGAVGVLELYLSPMGHWILTVSVWFVLLGLFVFLHYMKEKTLASGQNQA